MERDRSSTHPKLKSFGPRKKNRPLCKPGTHGKKKLPINAQLHPGFGCSPGMLMHLLLTIIHGMKTMNKTMKEMSARQQESVKHNMCNLQVPISIENLQICGCDGSNTINYNEPTKERSMQESGRPTPDKENNCRSFSLTVPEGKLGSSNVELFGTTNKQCEKYDSGITIDICCNKHTCVESLDCLNEEGESGENDYVDLDGQRNQGCLVGGDVKVSPPDSDFDDCQFDQDGQSDAHGNNHGDGCHDMSDIDDGGVVDGLRTDPKERRFNPGQQDWFDASGKVKSSVAGLSGYFSSEVSFLDGKHLSNDKVQDKLFATESTNRGQCSAVKFPMADNQSERKKTVAEADCVDSNVSPQLARGIRVTERGDVPLSHSEAGGCSHTNGQLSGCTTLTQHGRSSLGCGVSSHSASVNSRIHVRAHEPGKNQSLTIRKEQMVCIQNVESSNDSLGKCEAYFPVTSDLANSHGTGRLQSKSTQPTALSFGVKYGNRLKETKQSLPLTLNQSSTLSCQPISNQKLERSFAGTVPVIVNAGIGAVQSSEGSKPISTESVQGRNGATMIEVGAQPPNVHLPVQDFGSLEVCAPSSDSGQFDTKETENAGDGMRCFKVCAIADSGQFGTKETASAGDVLSGSEDCAIVSDPGQSGFGTKETTRNGNGLTSEVCAILSDPGQSGFGTKETARNGNGLTSEVCAILSDPGQPGDGTKETARNGNGPTSEVCASNKGKQVTSGEADVKI